jgi:Ala-tRNA(Pro) deacylase
MIPVESAFRFSVLFEHDLFRPAFARRSIKRSDDRLPGLCAGGKPASTLGSKSEGKLFRDHALMPATPATQDELFAYLDTLGIAHQTVTHPAVFTVEEARDLRGAVPGGHTKNLFLRDKKGATYLVVTPEDAAIELRSLHRVLGASGRFSFGSAELMRELLGVAPGSVTPFAAINDREGRVNVVLDAALMAHEVLNFHPLVNTATTSISREGLLKFLAATGHAPRIEPVSGAP